MYERTKEVITFDSIKYFMSFYCFRNESFFGGRRQRPCSLLVVVVLILIAAPNGEESNKRLRCCELVVYVV